MNVLLDECLPGKLKHYFPIHFWQTVPEAGLSGIKNGRLLSLAEAAGCEVFLTLDSGIQYQQNMSGRVIAVVIIRAWSNRLADLKPHVDACRRAIESINSGEVVRVGNGDTV